MKKFLALLLAFIMVVLPLTSCDQLSGLIEEDGFEEEEEETKKKTDKKEDDEDDEDDNDETKKNPFKDWFGSKEEPAVTDIPATESWFEDYTAVTYPGWLDTEYDDWGDTDDFYTSDDPWGDYTEEPWYSEIWTDYPWDETAIATSTQDPYEDQISTDPWLDYTDVIDTEDPWWDDTMSPSYTDYPMTEPGHYYPIATEPVYTYPTETEPGDPYYTETDDYITEDPWWDYTDAPVTDPWGDTNVPDTDWWDETMSPLPVETDNDCGHETFTTPNDYGEIGDDDAVKNQTLNIVVRNQLTAQREWYKDTPEDEVDEAIAMRNGMVASLLNLEVNYTLLGSSDYEDCLNTFNSAIMEDVDNDFHYYDIVANYAYAGANTLVRDYIANIADTDVFPYFDFSLPCWNQSIVSTTLIDDQLYYITGDLNLSTFDKSMVVFVNKYMYNDKKEASDPDDLQDIALEGNWDYEDLYRWASVYEDSNDDTVQDHEDFYGISTGFGSIPIDAMPYAWDLDFIVEEADGSHSYNIEGNDKIADAVDMAKDLFNGANGSGRVARSEGVGNWNSTSSCSMGGYSEPITHFANDTTIFALHLLYCTADDNVMLREMDSEFGLLPMPKFDEDQENYGTTAHDAYTLMTVIDHSESYKTTKGKAISAYLQLSSEESYTNVRGYYINEIIKQKYLGLTESVEKSQQIFDIIADNIELPFISVYAPQLNNVLNSCWREVVTESNNVSATTAEEAFTLDQNSYEAGLEDVDSWLGLI